MRKVMAQKDCSGHFSVEEMDFYIRTCPAGNPTTENDPRVDTIEQHLLTCEQCQNALQELDNLCEALSGVERSVQPHLK